MKTELTLAVVVSVIACCLLIIVHDHERNEQDKQVIQRLDKIVDMMTDQQRQEPKRIIKANRNADKTLSELEGDEE